MEWSADFILGMDLLAFFADRLKVYLREQGARHDLIDAVFSLGGQDDLLMIVKRVEALSKFLDSDDGKNLLAGVKRAINILKIEEKKDGRTYRWRRATRSPDQGRGEGAAFGDHHRRSAGPARPSRPKISKPPCGRSPSCAAPSMPSSTR